ncbi:uncharacterized protein LOC142219911 [Haematobia irritans]|uniref:uncharacterized protein LOC142219911 n=1 Tax=Haematobia irritans TaxID=7368 RepID=UPI003F507759
MEDDCRYRGYPAESTRLNHSGSFRWGTTPSKRSRINLDSTDDSLLEMSRFKNASKIECRIVTDVQSKGLASRIVKYHENESRLLNRSMSAHNLYSSRPGVFPLVTLKKTELPHRATTQQQTMTRIAPPDKSVFYGNTLSSLWRSNSVVGIQKSDEDISRENRPIIHPPPTENDMAPTRSVLDVLKEISRKRINSDDLDSMESSKKNRIGNDFLDAGVVTPSIISPSNASLATNCFKRQRDAISQCITDNSSCRIPDNNKSPEQIKKRICNYNNDIISSLSSSAKRKPNAGRRIRDLNQTVPVYLKPHESKKPDIGSPIETNVPRDKRFINLASMNADEDKTHDTIPQRSKSDGVGAGCASVQASVKPRLTLFNKNYEVHNDNSHKDIGNDDNSDENSECAGIHFVKPKKLISTGLKNPIIERTQKSKLALMLSGLKGELYPAEDCDEVDTSKPSEIKILNEPNKGSGPKSTNFAAKVDSTTNIGIVSIQKDSQANAPTVKDSSKPTEKTPEVSKISPLVGIKLTPQKNLPNENQTKISEMPKQTNAPVLGGFTGNSLTPTKSNANNTTVTETSTTSGKPSMPLQFGSLINPPNSESNVQPQPTPTGNFAFTPATTVASTSNVSKPAESNNSTNATVAANSGFLSNNCTSSSAFKFGPNPNTESKPKPQAAVSSTTTSPFTFGVSSNTSSTIVPATTPSATQFSFNSSSSIATKNNAFSFGAVPNKDNNLSFNTNSLANSNLQSASMTPSQELNFKQNSGATMTMATPAVFGSQNVTSNGQKAPLSTTNTPNVFSSPTVTSTEPNKQSSSIFGVSSDTNKTPSSLFATKTGSKESPFGSNVKALDPTTFTFGSTSTSSTDVGKSTSVDQNKPFTFASGANVSDKVNSSNIFGPSPSTTSAATPSTPGFSFGQNSGMGEKQNMSQTFNFGSNNSTSSTSNPTSNASVGGFSFSASTIKANPTSSSKPFSFGAPNANTNITQTYSNLFSAPVANSTLNTNVSFNFGSTPSVSTASTPNMANIFSVPPANAPTPGGDRPIRRATRRLHK